MRRSSETRSAAVVRLTNRGFETPQGGIVMSRRTALTLIVLLAALALPGQGLAASPNGSAGDMPALYDGQQFTINFKQEPSGAEAALLAHNGSINTIYMSDQAEAAGV